MCNLWRPPTLFNSKAPLLTHHSFETTPFCWQWPTTPSSYLSSQYCRSPYISGDQAQYAVSSCKAVNARCTRKVSQTCHSIAGRQPFAQSHCLRERQHITGVCQPSHTEPKYVRTLLSFCRRTLLTNDSNQQAMAV